LASNEYQQSVSDAEIFQQEELDTHSYSNSLMDSGLKGIAGLCLAIGLLPYVLMWRDTGTVLIFYGPSFALIWTGIVLWGFWYYFKRKRDQLIQQ
jgi:hypothetical protein